MVWNKKKKISSKAWHVSYMKTENNCNITEFFVVYYTIHGASKKEGGKEKEMKRK